MAAFAAVSSAGWAQDVGDFDWRPRESDEALEARSHEDGEALDENALLSDVAADALHDPAVNPRPELPEIDQRDADLRPIALPGGESKSAVTPQALSLPSDGGSVEGLGERLVGTSVADAH